MPAAVHCANAAHPTDLQQGDRAPAAATRGVAGAVGAMKRGAANIPAA